MTNAITRNDLILQRPRPLEQNAAVYVASLPANTGKRTLAQALRVVAGIFNTEINLLDWGALRSQHIAAIRARLAEAYKPETANKIISALRQTLKQAWLLGQMSGDKLDTSKGINSQVIYNMLGKRAQDARIKNFSPHDMRRTFVSDLLDAGADIATVAKWAGMPTSRLPPATIAARKRPSGRRPICYTCPTGGGRKGYTVANACLPETASGDGARLPGLLLDSPLTGRYNPLNMRV